MPRETAIQERSAPVAMQVHPGVICASTTNPRKTFDKTFLDELTTSVKQHGVLQPILIRTCSEKATPYMVIAGEQRWRAAISAQLQEIPVILHDLSDEQALELQVIENLHRKDLHPMEEAEGYEQLMRLSEINVDELAAKVHKSRAYIYGRLKLTALVPEARKAFFDGALNASTALLIARMIPQLQEKALNDIAPKDRDALPYRRAVELLRDKYMLELSTAVFDIKNEFLVTNVGSCVSCEKRTGNQQELFQDVTSADVCTDPVCFSAKRLAHWTIERAKASAKGVTIIEGDEAKRIMPHAYLGGYAYLEDYTALEELSHQNAATQEELLAELKRMKKKHVLIEHPLNKELIAAVPDDVADKISEKFVDRVDAQADTKFTAAASETSAQKAARLQREQENREHMKKHEWERAYQAEFGKQLMAVDAASLSSLEALQLLVFGWFVQSSDFGSNGHTLLKYLNLEPDQSENNDDYVLLVKSWIEAASPPELAKFMLALAFDSFTSAYVDDNAKYDEDMYKAALADLTGLDLESIHAATEPGKKKAAPAAKKAPAKKSPAKKVAKK